MNLQKRIAIAVGCLIVLFLAINYQFFTARVRFLMAPPAQPAVSEPTSTSSTPTVALGTPNELYIPTLGITAPVIYTTGTTESEWQEALKNGVVHYPTTPLPGAYGNVYIFGHSSNYPWVKSAYNAIFALLPKIAIGADITVNDPGGQPYTYRVIEKKIVGPKDLSVLDQHNNERKLLTLQTSYPIGTALQRYIVIAELVE